MDVEFHRAWGGYPTKNEHILRKTDSCRETQKKLNKIKEFLKNPKDIHEKSRDFPLNHEVTFPRKISLKKYVIGITCNFADVKTMNKIKKIIKEKGYNMTVMNGNYPVPTIDELMKNISN